MGDIEERPHCYCQSISVEPDMLRCEKCRRYFHGGCLKTGSPTIFAGDVFYHLKCADCSEERQEECTRMELQWLQVVMLALYNLQLTNSGKKGFFRWKEHICAYIDKHWFNFFGHKKRKTNTWFGTVAGTLSTNRPTHFKSGNSVLGESGWWCLAENKPPSLETLTCMRVKRPLEQDKRTIKPTVEGLRKRRTKTTLEAAMELKAKRAMTQETKDIRKGKSLEVQQMNKSGSLYTRESEQKTAVEISQQRFFSAEKSPQMTVAKNTSTTLENIIPNEFETSSASIEPSETSFIETESSFDDSHLVSEVSGDSSIINLSKSSILDPELIDQDSQTSVTSSSSALWLTERDLVVGDRVPQCLMTEDNGDDTSDLDIDICAITPPTSPERDEDKVTDSLPKMEELLSTLSKSKGTTMLNENTVQECLIKQESITIELMIKTEPSDDSLQDSVIHQKSVNVNLEKNDPATSVQVKQEAVEDEELQEEDGAEGQIRDRESNSRETFGPIKMEPDCEKEETEQNEQKVNHGEKTCIKPQRKQFLPISVFEENRLLKKLQSLGSLIASNPRINQLKRTLLVRQLKREHNLPVFNLDTEVLSYLQQEDFGEKGVSSDRISNNHLNPNGTPTVQGRLGDVRVLDRYQLAKNSSAYHDQKVSFLNRLVGLEDEQVQSIRSPYTARMLKPFIRRDYESKPCKLRLLQELLAYHHRNEPTWSQPPSLPIDYCYVRPQHIPSINTTCRQFFWPGIDLSECLQYPDFSCVVLYRKFIIGFAFMVPDVKYNEAYISFIFTHPDWRGAGIASFMLYHLIQTCMGKDVTLHVAASNPAMLLYQRFGFKQEEFILDFYDKYFPEDSKESRHAFFLRLRR